MGFAVKDIAGSKPDRVDVVLFQEPLLILKAERNADGGSQVTEIGEYREGALPHKQLESLAFPDSAGRDCKH